MGKSFQELDLSNAFLFAAALEDSETCRLVLEIILGVKLPAVKVHAEHSILVSSEVRSVRLDIYANDELEVNYNVEAQNQNEGNLPKRSRYHQAEMDVSLLKPGQDFNDLKPSYVIFICTFDPFGRKLYRYTFEERCLEQDFPLGDETKKIFLSTKGENREDVPEELIHFLGYMENSTDAYVATVTDENISMLHGKVKMLKKERSLEARYMTVEEWMKSREKQAIESGMKKGMAKGMEEGMKQGMEQGMEKGMKQGMEQGMAKGIAKSILQLLEEQGTIPKQLSDEILAQTDAAVLTRWLKLAAKTTSIEEFMQEM